MNNRHVLVVTGSTNTLEEKIVFAMEEYEGLTGQRWRIEQVSLTSHPTGLAAAVLLHVIRSSTGA